MREMRSSVRALADTRFAANSLTSKLLNAPAAPTSLVAEDAPMISHERRRRFCFARAGDPLADCCSPR